MSLAIDTKLPPSGWYPDPTGTPVLRWWDGFSWTNQVQPRRTPAAQPRPTYVGGYVVHQYAKPRG